MYRAVIATADRPSSVAHARVAQPHHAGVEWAALHEVERLKAEPADGHIDIGGPSLAASLIDLVDEFRMWVNPLAVGGGKPFFPAGVQVPLELLECRPFDSGVVWLRYARVRD